MGLNIIVQCYSRNNNLVLMEDFGILRKDCHFIFNIPKVLLVQLCLDEWIDLVELLLKSICIKPLS